MTNIVALYQSEVGTELYFPTTDQAMGGLGTVGKVVSGISAGKEVPFVSCKEAPGLLHNFYYLLEKQAKLKRIYGKSRVRPD